MKYNVVVTIEFRDVEADDEDSACDFALSGFLLNVDEADVTNVMPVEALE